MEREKNFLCAKRRFPMKLYYAPGACSLSPHIVLNEAGFDFKLEKVDLKIKKTETGKDYLMVNPKGYVPALELGDGQILTEGPAIVQYLADLKPESKLAPPNGSLERYRVHEMLNFVSTEIHKQYGLLFQPNTPEAQKKISMENLARRYGFVAKMLDGQSYLFGETFTIADPYFFTVTSWAKRLNVDLSPWPV